ncbi:MAG TPA: hypothetical protein VF221_05275 [Chloroflexota bacterium]
MSGPAVPAPDHGAARAVPVRTSIPREFASRVFVLGVVPCLFYFVAFCVLTWPALQLFSTHILGDEGDALQNVWNIWWVNKAITQLHTSPWHTTYLHYPYGTTLIGQTLNPYNGFMGVVLLRFLSLTEMYNVAVVFSFVVAGLTAFLLAYRLTGFYFGSIVAGYIYTFSNYHVVHTQGHLQLVSLEWIPLFLLFYWMLITRPTVPAAVGAAISLGLVILCDYYYFFYCVLAGALLLGWRLAATRRLSLPALKGVLLPAGVFAGLAAAFTAPLALTLLITNRNDPLQGYHDPSTYSLDLLSPFTPDSWWHFYSLFPTTWVSQANIEQVAYIGVSVTVMLVYALVKRRQIPHARVEVWAAIAAIFALLSLGPTLHVDGMVRSFPLPLPYTLLADVIPALSVGGDPSRMIVMTMLALAVIYAAGLRVLIQTPRGRWIAAPLSLGLLFIEFLPGGLPESQMTIPGYVQALLSWPDRGAVVNMVDGPGMTTSGLYYQTVDDRPMAFGYISRTPTSVAAKDSLLDARVIEMRNDILYQHYGFRYLVVPATAAFPFDPVVYRDTAVRVYRLGSESHRVRVEAPVRFVWGQDSMRQILPSSVIGETFTADRDGLRGVGFVLSMNYQIPHGPLVFHLQDAAHPGKGPDMATISIPTSALADGYLRVFTFPQIRHSRGHRYYAYLEAPSGTLDHSMWVWGSSAPKYRGGTVMVNHAKADGNLVMQLFYSAP